MKKLIVIIGLLVGLGAFAEDLDPVERKYKSKIEYENKRHEKALVDIKKLMIRDYERYLNQAMKAKNLKLAVEYQNKIKALKGENAETAEKSTKPDMEIGVSGNPNVKFDKKQQKLSLVELTPKSAESSSGFPVKMNVSRTGNNPYFGKKECKEYIYAEAASKVTFDIPEGFNRFSAVTYTYRSTSCLFIVECDEKEIYRSKPLVKQLDQKIKITLPRNAKELTLITDGMGDIKLDQTCWCFPTLSR